MLFYQHVYGRVARGYRSGSPGYQLAALSEPLNDSPELIAKLNQLSFFTLGGGKGTEARYSFYSPTEGFLAFGCGRLARDRSGAIGSFAHHFVCREEEFINGSASPVDVLRYLIQESKFYEGEAKLPANRSLPEVQFEPDASDSSSLEFQLLPAHLANMYLDKSERTIPIVVASDEDTWTILAGVFALLPRLEASRLSFSTLFVEASDFAGSFRLVVIPDSIHVPAEAYNYTIFEPRAKPVVAPPSKPAPIIRFWLESKEDFPLLLRLTNIKRHASGLEEEAATLAPKLLSHGKIFRDCVESLQIPGIYDLILRKAEWIVDYWRAGEPLRYEDFDSPLWNNPKERLPNLLDAARELEQPGLQRLANPALRALARKTAGGGGSKWMKIRMSN